jgi:hypothetical protein
VIGVAGLPCCFLRSANANLTPLASVLGSGHCCFSWSSSRMRLLPSFCLAPFRTPSLPWTSTRSADQDRRGEHLLGNLSS